MRIWLIKLGEPLPIDPEPGRLQRTGQLADYLSAAGHDVTWWTSTFDHSRKIQRFPSDTSRTAPSGYRIELLSSCGYARNASLQRILHHRGWRQRFEERVRSETPPDLVLSAFPVPEICAAAAHYGKVHHIPVVLDIRDLWPQAVVDSLPFPVRPVARLLARPTQKAAERACAQATALIGSSPAYVRYGLQLAGRPPSPWDRDFPLGYSPQPPPAAEQERAFQFWASRGLSRSSPYFVACFIGAFTRHFELESVVEAARQLQPEAPELRFVLCGTGERMKRLQRQAGACRNILFSGWVGAAEIWALMQLSRVGLAPYRSAPNFSMGLPNKPIEYWSAGLPVLSSLQGELEDLLRRSGSGLTYPNGEARELTRHLLRLHRDPDELRALSERARKLFSDRFDADKVYPAVTRHLEELVRSRIPSRCSE